MGFNSTSPASGVLILHVSREPEDFSMRFLRSMRWALLALVIMLIPVSSRAGVFVSVNFGPPALPVYDQPPCPEPGLMWTPGYWAYGPDGYYWVPGAWVPAPYEGALWTPGYWGWNNGLYVFHGGYWGRHVGYYGGINYGFGYGGIGFFGGAWHGHDFAYNTAVMHVNERFVHTTYVDRTVIVHNTIINNNRVAFSGGPGGIHHDPRPEERMAEHEQHMDRTSFQDHHEAAARSDRNSFAKFNGGRPSHVVEDHPLGAERHPEMMQQPRQEQHGRDNFNDRGHDNRNDYGHGNAAPQQQPRNQEHSNPQPQQQMHPSNENHRNLEYNSGSNQGPGSNSHQNQAPQQHQAPPPQHQAPPPPQHQAPAPQQPQHQAAPQQQHQEHQAPKDEHHR
jgi:hypothetical protein